MRQAREACYALRSFVESDPQWTQRRLRWDHVVVFPNTAVPADFAVPDCPRWKVIDRDDLSDIATRLTRVLLDQELDRPLLAADGIEALQVVLSGRGLPQRDVVARALENEDAADILTEHQSVILDAIRQLPRVEVRGERAAARRFWPSSRRVGSRSAGNGWRWCVTPTAWPATCSASRPSGRGGNNRPMSASSMSSA